LTDAEIESMIKDAEANAEEDKKKRELVDAKNSAENQIHMIRKELGEREITDEVKTKVEDAITVAEEAIKSEDKDKITQAMSDLMAASQPVFEAQAKDPNVTTVEAEEVK
jgi:molecular chaperone DnaK